MLEKQAERVNHIAEEEGGNRIYVSMDGAIFSSAEMERIIENRRLWAAIEAVRNGAEVMNSKTGEKLPLSLELGSLPVPGIWDIMGLLHEKEKREVVARVYSEAFPGNRLHTFMQFHDLMVSITKNHQQA